MADDKDSEFRFLPRPEAHSMKWNELLPPLRRAVRDLLLRLDGAVRKVEESLNDTKKAKGGEITANCFLVYGERGTGKSTVLFSARDAVCEECGSFFEADTAKKEGSGQGAEEACKVADERRQYADELREDAEKSAAALKERGVVWLDVLDLESLPPHANMLTTMLTRVQNALHRTGKKKSHELTSILEEDTESARHKLKQLINDATLMWEDIQEAATRDRANRQMVAADIYAHFRERFREAMEALCQELGRGSVRRDQYHPIVLPIDNIDRSTDHLHSIIKLAQMVACPHLWLVLAGDREDVETFLERAYWKELISIGGGGGGVGKAGLGGEDEALVMARRQAAAASHKLLPPSHRVEVELVKPEDTLRFSATSGAGRLPKQRICELLSQVPIPNLGNGPDINFLELLDASSRIGGAGEAGAGASTVAKKHLTQAARLGLQLPARGVLDLWQLAHWAVNDRAGSCAAGAGAEADDDFRAEKIARTMLRNVTAESKMSNEMGLYLQDKIIHREPDGTTILNFGEPNPGLSVTRYRAIKFERRLNSTDLLLGKNTEPSYAVRSTLAPLGKEEVLIFFLNRKDGNDDKPELPHLVTGWLAVLHDIMIQAERSWVVDSPIPETHVHFVMVKHEVVRFNGQRIRRSPQRLWWPAPHWHNFFTYDIFWLRWDSFLSSLEIKDGNRMLLTCPEQFMPWLLAVGWTACVIDTFWALVPKGSQFAGSSKPDQLVCGTNAAKLRTSEDMKGFETDVMRAAAGLYARIMGKPSNGERVFFKSEGVAYMRYWLEQKLPLLLSHLYVPMGKEAREQRESHLEALLAGRSEDQLVLNASERDRMRQLADAWKDNFPFIIADYRKDFELLFSSDETAAEVKTALPAAGAPKLEDLDSLDPFVDLYRLLRTGA